MREGLKSTAAAGWTRWRSGRRRDRHGPDTALIAGISRDGVDAGGLARGLDHSDAARFAFLLATPPILAAGLLKFGDLTGSSAATGSGPRR